MTLAKLLVSIGATTKAYHRGMARVRDDLGRTERRFGRFRGGLSKAGGALRSFGRHALWVGTIALVALAAGLTGSLNAAVQWEDAFAGVRKTVEATEPVLQQLSSDIREMATEIPVAATELAQLGETAGALGVPTDQIREFIRVTALIGVTTNVSSQEAADALGRLSNILGLVETDYSRFGSTLVALGNAGASTEAEILEITKRMGAAGKTAGLSTPEILGWASALASVSGMEPERAGTSMQMFLLQTTKIASGTSKKLTTMAKTSGLTRKAFKQLFAKDASAALLKFVTGLGKLTKAEKLATLEALGFTESGITRALLGMGGASEEVARQLGLANEAWGENTALTEEAEKRFVTTKSQLQILKNNLFDIGITLGTLLLPLLNKLVGGLNDWIQANQPLIEQVGTFLYDAITTVVGGISRWIDENQPLIRDVATLAKDVLTGLWTVLTTMVIPALFGKGGKGGIIPAMVELGRTILDDVIPRVAAFVDNLTRPGGVIDSVMKVVSVVLKELTPAFTTVVNALFGGNGHRGLIPALGDLAGYLWGDGKGPLATAVRLIGPILSALAIGFGIIADAIALAADALQRFLDTLAKLPNMDPFEKVSPQEWSKSILGPLAAPSTPTAPKTVFGPQAPSPTRTNSGALLGMAAGGIVPNGPVIVGEERAEVFDPRNRRIYPDAGEWARDHVGMGGDTYEVTINNPTGQPAEEDIGFALRRAAFLGMGRPRRRAGAAA